MTRRRHPHRSDLSALVHATIVAVLLIGAVLFGVAGSDRRDLRGAPVTDLDLACELLDLARHEIYDNRGNRARARTKEVLFSEDAGRLVREWEARKKSRLDPTPTSVRVHENNQTRQAVTR